MWCAGLLYCMSYLAQNMDWLREQLQPLQQSKVTLPKNFRTLQAGSSLTAHPQTTGNTFLIFDCPGQLELYTFDQAFKRVVETLTTTWHFRYSRYSTQLQAMRAHSHT